MKDFPILETDRLVLSEITSQDIPTIVDYLQDKVISDNTATIPYPYNEGHAEFWLNLCKDAFENNKGHNFAIRNKKNEFLGSIGIHNKENNTAEIGYWVGLPNWNKGYATEASKAILSFGFSSLELDEIYGDVYPHNHASAIVLEKVGMIKKEILKDYVKKGEDTFDLIRYSILKKDFIF
jgi:RimJ/RimL family protein N-acetyltransferase